jgi:DNA anti-recombination protein RmuC
MRLYQPATGAASAVQMTTAIVDDHNRRRYGQQTSIDASSFSAGGSDYIVNLPLADLEPGSYLLTIDAKAGIFVERRDMKFLVK